MKDNIIVNSICEYIKEKILSKEMFPGYRIMEDEIANELGVSRTPLRRALAQLQYEGFVYIIPNRGTYVVQSSYEDIEKIYAARICLEVGLSKDIINNVTSEDIDELKELHVQLQRSIESISAAEYSTMNKKFHVRLANISQNEYLIRYLEEIHNRISLLLVYYDSSLQNVDSLVAHGDIITALENKDLESLVRAIKADADLADYEKSKLRQTQTVSNMETKIFSR